MPYLIDGNNLMHAMSDEGVDVGRHGLCELLAVLVASDRHVHVVFDGAAPPDGVAAQIALSGVEVSYAAPRSADDVIADCIASNTAPRRVTVVSSDRQVRSAGRRRRCKLASSQDFSRPLLKLNAPDRSPGPSEPPEKRNGLSDEQSDQWLREFGY